MRLSLGLVLALCLAGLQLIAVLVVVTSSYFSSERVLLSHARDLLSDVAANTIEHSRGFLSPAEAAAELATRLAENEIVASDDAQVLEKLLFQQLQTAPQFAGIFYGDETGSFVYVMRSDGPGPYRTKIIARDGDERSTDLIWRDRSFALIEARKDPEDTFDPRARPWYQNVEAVLGSVWTDPYIFFSSQKPGITVASPVYAEGRALKGVVGVDIEIDAISDFLANLQVGTGGTALILNRNGDVIAHPRSELIKKRREDGGLQFVGIDEIEDPIARAAFAGLKWEERMEVVEETTSVFRYNDADYVATVTPVMSQQLPWTIGVFAPEEDFIGGIKASQLRSFAIAAAVAAMTAGVGLLIAGLINRPVRALANRATRISQGEFDDDTSFPLAFTELKRANDTITEEARRRRASEEQYGMMFESASRGMAEVSPQTGQFLRINRRCEEILGLPAETILSKTVSDLAGTLDLEGLFDSFGAGAREIEYQRPDGSRLWLTANFLFINDAHGQPYHSVMTLDDVTKERAAEEKIRALNNDLATNARLNTMGQMAAGLAHELNQPLTAITQNADAAISTAEKLAEDGAELTEILTEIDAQAHRAGDIIRALRAFVRKDDMEKTIFDLHELVEQTIGLVAVQARQNRVTIEVAGEHGIAVEGSRVQVAQVLVNLLQNAIEAMSGAASPQREITVQLGRSAGRVSVDVSDTGPGVDPDISLFTEFETTKATGMGLGLSICKTIVESHGGILSYSRGPEVGGTFHFTLPIGEQNV